jgi:hypothetical protein
MTLKLRETLTSSLLSHSCAASRVVTPATSCQHSTAAAIKQHPGRFFCPPYRRLVSSSPHPAPHHAGSQKQPDKISCPSFASLLCYLSLSPVLAQCQWEKPTGASGGVNLSGASASPQKKQGDREQRELVGGILRITGGGSVAVAASRASNYSTRLRFSGPRSFVE